MIETVAHALRTGIREVEISTPSVAEKRLIVTRLLEALKTRALILSPNLAMQAVWHDRCEKISPVLDGAARKIWGDVSLHPVSVLPYSCAPVVLLTIPSLPSGDENDPGVDAARLSRHLVKFRYRLVILDCVEELSSSWKWVVDSLREAANASIVRISHHVPTSRSELTDVDGLLRVTQSFPALVRDGVLPPFDVYARVAGDSRTEAQDPSVEDDRPPTVTGRIDLLMEMMLHEAQSMQDRFRSLVVVDSALGTSAGNRPKHEETVGRLLLSAMSIDERVASLHPILLTGSTMMCRDDMVIPLLSDIQRLIGIENWDVRLSHEAHDELSELHGSGADWNSRSYVIAVQELINRDITRCVIVEADLLKYGWFETRVNTVFDLSTEKVRHYIGQHLHVHEGPVEQSVPFVRYWDLLQATDEGRAKSLCRWADNIRDIFIPADDGAIERGPGAVHPGLSRVAPVHSVPADIDHQLIPDRRVAARAWGLGTEYSGREIPAVSIHLQEGENRSASHRSMLQIKNDIARYQERGSTLRLQGTLWGVLVVGAVLSAFLLLPLFSGAIAAGICTGFATLAVMRQWLRLRAMQPSEVSVPMSEYLQLVGGALLVAMQAAGLVEAGEVVVTRRKNNWYRLVLKNTDIAATKTFAEALMELFADPGVASHALLISRVDTGRFGVRTLARLPSLDVLYVNDGVLPIPSCMAGDSLRRQAFESAFSSLVGRAVVIETPIELGVSTQAHLRSDAAVLSSIWE
ncbi:MAG: hypothetical protein HY962_00725 [Ignavibacteriae bacterium]|nr:hypothetical protein [Ignavibacteriota bacterium]